MSTQPRTWLQLYVDAVMEKDPQKRLAMVRELRQMPKRDDSEEVVEELSNRAARKSKVLRRN
jgi:hypothetical protein